MRILVVQESDWLEKGPHQSHHLMERLAQRGHEIRVIDFEIGWRRNARNGLIGKQKVFCNVKKAVEGPGVTVIRPPIVKIPVLDYISLIYTHAIEIKKQIKEFKPDVIVGFGILNANIGIRLAKREGIPFVYYIIDELHRLIPQRVFQRLGRFIESCNMKRADMVLSINEGLRDYTIQMGARRDKTRVIRAGIDFERFNPNIDGSPIRKRYGIKDGDIVLFFMGWLYEFSGLKEVALELAQKRKEYENIKLMVLGKGDLWETLQKIRKKYNIEDRIIIQDWVPYEEVPEHIAAADICILPAYKNEIMKNIVPIKMYEYMAMGKPVIATWLPGLVKEFGEGNGVIYIDRPEEAMMKTIDLINTFKHENNSSAAWEFVKDNDWNKVTCDFLDTLVTII